MKYNWKDMRYQGWRNYYTWNVALFLNNEYGLYMCMQEYKKYCKKHNMRISYTGLIKFAGLENEATPDGVSYNSHKICRREITECVIGG